MGSEEEAKEMSLSQGKNLIVRALTNDNSQNISTSRDSSLLAFGGRDFLLSPYGNQVVVRHAAVATDDERCSQIGKYILLGVSNDQYGIEDDAETGSNARLRGNAIDAAVAAALCLGVVSSASSGIGGGAFMLLMLNDGTTKAFDMREMAPLAASKDMYHGNKIFKSKGALSIAVPGELAGLYEVWKQYGKLPWRKLVMPSVKLAERGSEISPYLAWEMRLEESSIFENEGLREIFTTKGKDGRRRLLKAGEICYNQKLAETLKIIAREGIEPFYNGVIGENLIRDIQDHGGIMDMDDLKSYEVKMKRPISADILGMTILGMPPPSAGGVGIVLMLHILAQYRATIDISNPLWVHRMIESMKHLFAIRMNIGDPDFADVTRIVSDMLSTEYAKELQKMIKDDRTFGPEYYGGKWQELRDYMKNEYGTSHLSIIDDQGNAVALTASNNYHFGSKILSPSTGILLNNHMDDFCMPLFGSNGEPVANNNYIEGGKRPQSSMSPSILIKNGLREDSEDFAWANFSSSGASNRLSNVQAVVGGSGGTMIIPGVSHVIVNMYSMYLNPNKSVNAPRVYHQLIPNVVQYEDFTSVTGDHYEVNERIRKSLKEKGHVLEAVDSGTVCQVITLKQLLTSESGENAASKAMMAVSDSRKGGVPAGY